MIPVDQAMRLRWLDGLLAGVPARAINDQRPPELVMQRKGEADGREDQGRASER
jgi:hypothetical protein